MSSILCLSCVFFFYCSAYHRYLPVLTHSFPTRRSSDLVEVRLSDWVFNAIRSNEVLTLNRQYFLLRKPLERRLYEFSRKHCVWTGKVVKFGLDRLQR